jgi:hypothetical protein
MFIVVSGFDAINVVNEYSIRSRGMSGCGRVAVIRLRAIVMSSRIVAYGFIAVTHHH